MPETDTRNDISVEYQKTKILKTSLRHGDSPLEDRSGVTKARVGHRSRASFLIWALTPFARKCRLVMCPRSGFRGGLVARCRDPCRSDLSNLILREHETVIHLPGLGQCKLEYTVDLFP